MLMIENRANLKTIKLKHIKAHWFEQHNMSLHVLRLDEIHKIVSGNKWFKLKYYLQDAKAKGFDTIATFGGAYSNHIVAAAYAAMQEGFKSTGVIRGEKSAQLSRTLLQAQQYGMQLKFISRQEYKNKGACKQHLQNVYWINEGGYGNLGVKGASEILEKVENLQIFTHIVCAVGTGTTLAGIIQSAYPEQQIIGISSMKGNTALVKEVKQLLPKENQHQQFSILHNYHFGGYAKYNEELINFMKEVWAQHHLPTDFVYTAKTFYAIKHLIATYAIPKHSRILMVHTGGLQGNLSLPAGMLPF
jgi:1-aminocyclopropane-1-carboxylate deaminase